MTSAWPALLKIDTWPPVPTPIVTWLATVWPATKLRFDAFGRGWPAGHTVRCDAAAASVTVTLATIDDTWPAGTPPAPVAANDLDSCAVQGLCAVPVPSRESTMRAGVKGWNNA